MLKTPPSEPFVQFGKAKAVRLVYYPAEGDELSKYTEEEITALRNFKEYCQKLKRNVPECDGEILRWFYANKFDNKKTLAAIDLRNTLLCERLPFKVTDNTFQLINNGFMYIAGRDRLFRPILIIRYSVLAKMKPHPPIDDIIAVAIINIIYVIQYMLKQGVVENIL